MSTLYLVATPIGNLEDISQRALRILGEVRLIAAEDTRHTRKLLTHFDIRTPLTSYFEHNKREKLDEVVSALEQGDVALVSDAGTPGLNDPGYLLVRAALEAGHQISPIPGPSAPIAALVVSGLPTDQFLYLGYLPRKSSERRRFIAEAADSPYTLIFLETPHRLLPALGDLQAELGDRQIAIACELTKMFEQVFRGSLRQAQAFYQEQPARGEFTLVVAGAEEEQARWSQDEVMETLQAHLAQGEAPSQIAKSVAAESGWPRRRLYDLLTEMQANQ